MKKVFSEVQISELLNLLSEPKRIVITTHHKPDGDALGSSLGLRRVLEKAGHRAEVVVPSEFPQFLSWMSGASQAVDFIRDGRKARELLSAADLVFCLDFNEPSRVEQMKNELVKITAPIVLIDHHLTPMPGFGKLVFSFPDHASTAELLVHILLEAGLDHLLDRESAECLYTGIMTDTGSFRFNSVSAVTHRMTARLMEEGVRNDWIHEAIYDTNSFWRMRFLGFTLYEKMEILEDFRTVVITATQSDMDRFNHQPGDLEGIVNYGLSISGVKVSVLMAERDGLIKISFRSKGTFSVKDIAEKYFEGGGHRNAAGGRSRLSLQQAVQRFKEVLPEYYDELNK
ncbi:MAG: bifunctional oligoribonuclease/PAP phosphatase NrnA [Bacteroidia bacterium]